MRATPTASIRPAVRRVLSVWRLALILALSLLPTSTIAVQPVEDDAENEVKAEFIERFTSYIDWPPQAFVSDSAAFTFCITGDGPLRPYLERILTKARIKGRPVILVALKSGDSEAGCHSLYIAPSEVEEDVERIVDRLDGKPVLTIGDSEGFEERGVLINLFLEGTHVRFAINALAARKDGLNISAKLLMLAKRVNLSR